MNVTWITQAGLVFENEKMTVMVDPYLSNSVAETLDPSKQRRIPVDESVFEIHPDVIIITHDHLDHVDIDAIPLMHKESMRFFAPSHAEKTLRSPMSPFICWMKSLAKDSAKVQMTT